MKERRKGALGRATNLAEGVAAVVRRRAREREPRVLVYESPGFPALVPPGSREWDRLLDVCERMVEIEGAPPGEEAQPAAEPPTEEELEPHGVPSEVGGEVAESGPDTAEIGPEPGAPGT